jgi:hypothetical protein
MDNLTQNPETTQTTPATPTPKPRTEAQIAASRANGAKSKGPVTPEGKAISSQNAVRHGLLARLAIMDVENRDSFLSLCTDMRESFAPTDEYEQCLVDTMTLSMWRRTRAMAMETSGLQVAYRKHRALAQTSAHQPSVCNFNDIHDVTFCGLVANPREQHVIDLLHRYESRHTRAFERALKCLVAYRNFRKSDPLPTPPEPQQEPEPEPTPTPTPEPPAKNEPKEPEPRPLSHGTESRQLRRQRERRLKKRPETPGPDRASATQPGQRPKERVKCYPGPPRCHSQEHRIYIPNIINNIAAHPGNPATPGLVNRTT